MHFSWLVPGKVSVTIPKYISDVLEYASDVTGVCSSPAASDLFVVGNSELLSAAGRERFHTLSAKLLYLAKRVRPDILLPVSYLVRRVRTPNLADQRKLERVVKYLRGSQQFGFVLEPDREVKVSAWIDASYGVHDDMRSHTGALVGLGKGPVWSKSSARSETEQ
jgi:hypothetical protein